MYTICFFVKKIKDTRRTQIDTNPVHAVLWSLVVGLVPVKHGFPWDIQKKQEKILLCWTLSTYNKCVCWAALPRERRECVCFFSCMPLLSTWRSELCTHVSQVVSSLLASTDSWCVPCDLETFWPPASPLNFGKLSSYPKVNLFSRCRMAYNDAPLIKWSALFKHVSTF